jgi:epoxyqueuosine reductase
VIRGTAYWAIGQLGVKEPEMWLERLQRCAELEPEEEALQELQPAIERLQAVMTKKQEKEL